MTKKKKKFVILKEVAEEEKYRVTFYCHSNDYGDAIQNIKGYAEIINEEIEREV